MAWFDANFAGTKECLTRKLFQDGKELRCRHLEFDFFSL
jgi:hypothetical protein